MDKVKETIVEVKDFYGDNCLADQVNDQVFQDRRPKGEVHIYEQDDDGTSQLVRKSNLVVYSGREMLAQRIVNTNNPAFSGDPTKPTRDEFISWFGLGEGGVRPADPLDPVPPINNDEYLYAPIPVSDTTGSLYADYHPAGSPTPGGGVYPASGAYTKSFDGIEFQQDVLNDSRYLVLQITTTIGVNDANGYQLSEAGLFSAESSGGGYSGNFTLFARVTFPSLIKTVDRRLIFIWYLYV